MSLLLLLLLLRTIHTTVAIWSLAQPEYRTKLDRKPTRFDISNTRCTDTWNIPTRFEPLGCVSLGRPTGFFFVRTSLLLVFLPVFLAGGRETQDLRRIRALPRTSSLSRLGRIYATSVFRVSALGATSRCILSSTRLFLHQRCFWFFSTTFFVAFVFTTANFLLLLLLLLFLVPGGRPLGYGLRRRFSRLLSCRRNTSLGILGVSGSHLPHPRGDHRHFEHRRFSTPTPWSCSSNRSTSSFRSCSTAAEAARRRFRFLPAFSMSGGLKIFGGFTSRLTDVRAFLMLLFLLFSLDDCKALFLPINFRGGMAKIRGRTPEFASSMLFSLSPTSNGCVVSISSSSSSLSSSLSPFRNIFPCTSPPLAPLRRTMGVVKQRHRFASECIGRRLNPGVAEYTTIGDGLSSDELEMHNCSCSRSIRRFDWYCFHQFLRLTSKVGSFSSTKTSRFLRRRVDVVFMV